MAWHTQARTHMDTCQTVSPTPMRPILLSSLGLCACTHTRTHTDTHTHTRAPTLQVAHTPFKRVAYTEAIELLEKAVAGGKKFEHPVSVGLCREGQRLTNPVTKKCSGTVALSRKKRLNPIAVSWSVFDSF